MPSDAAIHQLLAAHSVSEALLQLVNWISGSAGRFQANPYALESQIIHPLKISAEGAWSWGVFPGFRPPLILGRRLGQARNSRFNLLNRNNSVYNLSAARLLESMKELRIIIADDHPLFRLGVRTILETQPGWTVCAQAMTGREAVALALEHKPDLAILSISLPELNGLDATRQIRRGSPGTEVLILTMHNSDKLLAEAFSAGARGYLLKTDSLRLFVAAVETIAQHKPFLSAFTSGLIPGGLTQPANGAPAGAAAEPALRSREREIVQLLVEGESNKGIATKLKISVKTVNAHRTNIMRRLNFHSVTQLVRYAIRENIILA